MKVRVQWLLLSMLLGLAFTVNAEEAEKNDNGEMDEEIANHIFDVWYEGKNVHNKCNIFNGYIDLLEIEGQVYLKTVVNEEISESFLAGESNMIFFIISKAVDAAIVKENTREGWAFVDAKTRCAYWGSSEKPRIQKRCYSHFTKKEFEERLKQKNNKK